MRQTALWVAIINYNGWRDTLECLASLSQSSYRDFTPLVVDNASRDDSVMQIRAKHPEIEMIRSESNLGYSGGCNLAIRMARERGAAHCLVLNNDLVVDAHALRFLIRTASAHPAAAAVGPAVMDYFERDRVLSLGGRVNLRTGWSEHLGRNQSGQDISTTPIDVQGYIDGCALMFMLEKIDVIGMMDQGLFMYFDDTDWCYRARKLGFSLVIDPMARVWHKVGGSTRKEDVRIAYWFQRNRIAFEKKHASMSEWILFWLGMPWHTFAKSQLTRSQTGNTGTRHLGSLASVTTSILTGLRDGLLGTSAGLERYQIV